MKPFDFDRVYIKAADDFDVERFVMVLRNAPEEWVSEILKNTPVRIDKHLELSANKVNLLKLTFKQVEKQ